jgi:hypothetical protein
MPVAENMTFHEHETYHRAHDAAYNVEHFGSYFLALVAIGLSLLGMLTAFHVLELRDYGAGSAGIETSTSGARDSGFDTGVAEVGGAGIDAQSVTSDSFWDGILLLTTGLSAGMLAMCLHRTDHHRARDPRTVTDTDAELWTAEHGGAYLFALGSVALGTVALLAGFDALGADTDQRDGTIWAFAAFGASILTTMLHGVQHHQTLAEEDHRVVRERAVTTNGSRAIRPSTQSELGRERSP